MLSIIRTIVLAGSVMTLASSAALAGPAVYAVGDIHGDYAKLAQILTSSGLIDKKGHWTGGDSILVQTGDFLDRGPDIIPVMDLLINLQREAPKSGGQVIVLLGNHEMMNITGDLRYVTKETFARFADKNSSKDLDRAYRRYLEITNRQLRKAGQPEVPDTLQVKAEWMEIHPLGYLEYREAMGPKKKYGKWLRQLPAVAEEQGIIFAHGGLHPNITDLELDQLNERILKERSTYDIIHEYLIDNWIIDKSFTMAEAVQAVRMEQTYLASSVGTTLPQDSDSNWQQSLAEPMRRNAKVFEAFLDMGNWMSVHPQGPLWLRDYSTWEGEEGIAQISDILKRYKAHYFVVGHTISDTDKITQRLEGKVFLIDTLKPSILRYQDGRFSSTVLPALDSSRASSHD